MREQKTLLYLADPTSATGRTTTINLADDIDKYDILRIFVGFSLDGFTVVEWDVKNRNYTTGIVNGWTYYIGSVATDNPGSLRWNLFRFTNSTTTAEPLRLVLTYLNTGTTAYSNKTNNDWGPKPIYKIYGIKYV